jgi:UDP-N-acetylmuramyl pentapeptide phosphotransferase/UDP-N-acetylglucosamine-1-phosphate transferase
MIDKSSPGLLPTLDSIEPVLWPTAALLAFVFTAIFVDLMILLAARWRLVDLPNRRSAHALPTARGGGLAIVSIFALAALAVAARWPDRAAGVLGGAVLPCLVIAAVGFVDDMRPLRASLRLLIQIGIAVWIVAVLGPLDTIEVPGSPPLPLGMLGWPLTVVWIVGMTNAFNFMDGSDGMAGLGAVVVCLGFVAIGQRMDEHVPMLLAAFLAAAAAGFLVFNWPPARIFMGDVGSGFLGTFLAALPLLFPAPVRAVVFLPCVLCLWPYVYDPLLSVLRRLWNGHNPLVPHREFLFHRLIRSGVSHARTAMLYAALAAVGAGAAWVSLDGRVAATTRALVALATAVIGPAALTWGVERRCARVELVPAERGHAPKPR